MHKITTNPAPGIAVDQTIALILGQDCSDGAVPDAFPCMGWNAAIGAPFSASLRGNRAKTPRRPLRLFFYSTGSLAGSLQPSSGSPFLVYRALLSGCCRAFCDAACGRIGRRCGSNWSCHEWHSGQENSTTLGGRKIPTIGSSSARISNHWNPPRSPNVSCCIGRPGDYRASLSRQRDLNPRSGADHRIAAGMGNPCGVST